MESGQAPSILRTAGEVREWRRSLLRQLPATPVAFQLDGLPRADNERLAQRAERYRRACGCEAGGAAGMLAVLLSSILWLMPAIRPPISIANIIATAGAIVAAALVARLAALGWARLSLIRLAGAVERVSH